MSHPGAGLPDEDLLADTAAERFRSEYEDQHIGWSAWPGHTRSTPYDDELPDSGVDPMTETDERGPELTPAQQLGLLAHRLGAHPS